MRRLNPRRLAILAVVLGVGALVLAVGGVLGAGAGLWPPMAGVATVGVSVALAAVAVVDGAVALWIGRGSGIGRLAMMGVLAGLALIGTWILQQRQLSLYPATHDAATSATPGDMSETPQFTALKVPASGPVAYAGVREFAVTYGEPEMLDKVVALGRASGWRIVSVARYKRSYGKVEATDVSSAYGFTDAIVVETVQASDGVCVVRMRSAALDQRGGDGGRNAARVRGFLRSLATSIHPKPPLM